MTLQKLNSYQWVIIPICTLILGGIVFNADARYVKGEYLREKEQVMHKIRQEDMLAINNAINRVELESKAKYAKLDGMIEAGRIESADINRRLERIIAQLEMVIKRMDGM